MKNVTEVIGKQVIICGNGDIMFSLEHGSASSKVASPSITTEYTQTCYRMVKKNLMKSLNRHTCVFRITTGIWICLLVLFS